MSTFVFKDIAEAQRFKSKLEYNWEHVALEHFEQVVTVTYCCSKSSSFQAAAKKSGVVCQYEQIEQVLP